MEGYMKKMKQSQALERMPSTARDEAIRAAFQRSYS
jgi:hypothetical protein